MNHLFKNTSATRRLYAAMVWLAGAGLAGAAQTPQLTTTYQNQWFNPVADVDYEAYFQSGGEGAGVAFFGGSGVTTDLQAPSTSSDGLQLLRSAFGQPVESQVAQYAMGDIIRIPDDVDATQPPAGFLPVQVGNNPAAYYESSNPQGAAFWIPSQTQLVAAAGGTVEVKWNMVGGGTLDAVYTIASVPTNRPVRLFWTESPYNAPTVQLVSDSQPVFATLHYNNYIGRPSWTTVTNHDASGAEVIATNLLNGVWLDGEGLSLSIKAVGVEGIFLLEYFADGSYTKSLGVQPVQVMPPTIQNITAELGTRLLPNDLYYGTEDLVPQLTSDSCLFLNQLEGSKWNWLFGVARNEGQPWTAEVYWMHADARGVTWPFEVDWYTLSWPLQPPLTVLGDAPYTDTPSVLLPGEVTTQIIFQEPGNVVRMSLESKTMNFRNEGYALIQYSTFDNVWFDVRQAVKHDNPVAFDLLPRQWEIANEIRPEAQRNYALYLDGNSYVEAALDRTHKQGASFTVEAWVRRMKRDYGKTSPILSFTSTNAAIQSGEWELGYGSGPDVIFDTFAGRVSYTLEADNDLNQWHHLAGVYDGAQLLLYVDGVLVASSPRTQYLGSPQLQQKLTLGHSYRNDSYFTGKIDEIRLWNKARTQEEIVSSMSKTLLSALSDLSVTFNLNEAAGRFIKNWLSGSYGTIHGQPRWVDSLDLSNDSEFAVPEFPGYLYRGSAYNPGRYAYPTADAPDQDSYLFPVNTDDFEVWWANGSPWNSEMPASVFYPSLVRLYESHWPTNAPEIIIASGLGSHTNRMYSPSVYYQNNPDEDGYNPNEEHALTQNGVVYALRDDLNAPGGQSEPFVLVDDVDAETDRPVMWSYHVVRETEEYPLRYSVQAGSTVLPPMPLAAMSGCGNSTSIDGPAWRDRKTNWWAKAAGADGGNTEIVMQFYYAMQPGFNFPKRSISAQPAIGTELPWLPTTYTDAGTGGTPADLTYTAEWPTHTPVLSIAQTLTTATEGLPDIWNQSSTELLYQQSVENGYGDSVSLFDAVIDTGVNMDFSIIQEMLNLSMARQDWTSSRYLFEAVPPALCSRLYYDPTRGENGQLVLFGMLYSPLTGAPYLLPNWLTDLEKDSLLELGTSLSSGNAAEWRAAVEALPTAPTYIVSNNQAIGHAALSTAVSAHSNAVGYVTLAFNNSTIESQVPAAMPISLSIFRVDSNLYTTTYLDVLESDNVLDEKLSMRVPLDFGGAEEEYEFDWRWSDPVLGQEPTTPFDEWLAYGSGTLMGAVGIDIIGNGPFMLTDHYFAVRYRRADGNGPSGDRWSKWTSNLAPGWIQRVMNGINPYEQRLNDMVEYAPNMTVSMIAQAGAPYEGPVALNNDSVNSAGLIQIYQTVLDRALSLTLNNASYMDANANDSLLFAASRLCDLYTLLGNEAYADAMDPTIGFGNDTGWFSHYGAMSTSLFSFMNQMTTLLDEELALLRGRDDSMSPAVSLSPVFNRLMWNYTYGIDGGEVAYAANYNIKGNPTNTTGTITAEDAKRAYPQGHGDAWGHYLSALNGFYRLMAYTNFGWNTIPGATMVGNASVSTDFFDEQKFAEAAAAKARTGAEIINRTHRRDYKPAALNQRRQFYSDTNTNRQWGVDGWAARAGQGAYFDWVVGNSLMWDSVTNLTQLGGSDAPAEGLYIIDRHSVPELDEITTIFTTIQQHLDRVDAGLNPLGLVDDVIPFDISVAEADAGKTHFEQIYERATAALQNAALAFQVAQDATRNLRTQNDSIADFTAAAAESDISYNNQLIEIFGYPYSDDIGVGKTYPQGYDGPDLLNFQILDLDDTFGLAPISGVSTSVFFRNVSYVASNKTWTNVPAYEIEVQFNAQGLQLKPADWTGRRAAIGEVQADLYDFVVAYYNFLRASDNYNLTMDELNTLGEALNGIIGTKNFKDEQNEAINKYKKLILQNKAGLAFAERSSKWAAEITKTVLGASAQAIPSFIVGLLPGTLNQMGEASLKVAAYSAWGIAMTSAELFSYIAEANTDDYNKKIVELEAEIQEFDTEGSVIVAGRNLNAKIQTQYVARDEVLAAMTAMEAALEKYFSTVEKGKRLIAEQARERSRVAQRVQQDRYTDMLFRIYRDEALRKYNSLFDIAARYSYLAARAYDYETGLMNTAGTQSAASTLLTQIVKSRSLGRMADGQPLAAGVQGDPGLADALARMKADWDVVKGRLGFNNPDTERSRISLRQELLRISPAAASDSTWQNALETYRVDNLYDIPEYREYCIPFSSSTNREPGLVIPFASSIIAGQNFFGNPLAGGDNAFDATHFATKIRSVGIWFSGYNISFNTNAASGGGLANEPRVYLVPVGNDIMRSPGRNGIDSFRSWKVFDQSLPLPYNIGLADLDTPNWQPLTDSVSGSFAQRRRHPSLRVYHDRGQFTDSELCTNSRLIGRSVWNTRWMLIIPGRTLLSDPDEAIERFIYGARKSDNARDGYGVTDIKLYFNTYAIPGE